MPPARQVIDSAAFARERGRIEGSVDIAGLERLAEVVADSKGALGYSVSGAGGASGELFLDLEVAGGLLVQCQRCLQAFPLEVDVHCRFRLIEAGQAWPDDELADDDYDAIAAERELDVIALLEQEVLLSLPLAPRHERCTLPEPHEPGQAESPFAALAGLKRDLH